jgi:acetyltransferase-like isoleucine patch superfamily enzyme
MIRIIKYICHKIYSVGKFEEMRINQIRRKEYINRIAVVGKDAFISDEINFSNASEDRNKIKIGQNSRIMGDLATIFKEGEIIIGDNCFFGPQSRIWATKKIQIGNRVLISHNVNIHDNNSHPVDWKLRHDEFLKFVETGRHHEVDLNSQDIIIEDDVWIGFNSIILKGVRIGRGAIIGAGSVVLKDVEPWTVNVGNPLRCIKKLEPENRYDSLNQL